MADDDASRPVIQAGVRKSMNVIGRYFEHAMMNYRSAEIVEVAPKIIGS